MKNRKRWAIAITLFTIGLVFFKYHHFPRRYDISILKNTEFPPSNTKWIFMKLFWDGAQTCSLDTGVDFVPRQSLLLYGFRQDSVSAFSIDGFKNNTLSVYVVCSDEEAAKKHIWTMLGFIANGISLRLNKEAADTQKMISDEHFSEAQRREWGEYLGRIDGTRNRISKFGASAIFEIK